MTQREMIQRLLGAGIPVTHYKISSAIKAGHVQRPMKDGAGNHVYREKHLRQMQVYIENARPGRPPLKKHGSAVRS